MNKILLPFLIAIFIFSCENNQIEQLNGDNDLKRADSLSGVFYEKLRKKDYLYLKNMYQYKEEKNHFMDVFKLKDSILGDIDYVKYIEKSTKRVIKKDSLNVNYYITTKVNFTNGGIAEEEVHFNKINDSTFLGFYHFNIVKFGKTN